MGIESRHVSIQISRPEPQVYRFVADPTNLPAWAPGLCDRVDQVDGEWVISSPMGRAVVKFAPRNDFGVADHWVAVGGQTFHNPLRVIADGQECEVVFTVRRFNDVTDEEFDRDVATVGADLARLKDVLED